jgi:hypothetical protein
MAIFKIAVLSMMGSVIVRTNEINCLPTYQCGDTSKNDQGGREARLNPYGSKNYISCQYACGGPELRILFSNEPEDCH